MSNVPLMKFVQAAFDDGTLAQIRTPEELLEELKTRENPPEGTLAFLVSQSPELNELSPVELLAGSRFKVQQELGVDSCQTRYLELSVEERVAMTMHAVRDWRVPY